MSGVVSLRRVRLASCAIATAIVVPLWAQPRAQEAPAEGQAPVVESAALPADAAVLQGLDKITARISTFDAPIDEPVRFGSLEIVARTCHKTPPEEPPERAAFLEVTDIRPDSPEIRLFTGWMFASSPAVSALEHPVYDVWVIDCRNSSNSTSESSTGN